MAFYRVSNRGTANIELVYNQSWVAKSYEATSPGKYLWVSWYMGSGDSTTSPAMFRPSLTNGATYTISAEQMSISYGQISVGIINVPTSTVISNTWQHPTALIFRIF